MIASLDEAACAQLAEIGTRRTLATGRTLFRQGDAADHVFLVTQGRIRIVLTTPSGRELLVAKKGPGELVGELACLDDRDRTATAIAEVPSAGAVIDPERFLDALADHGALAVSLLRGLSVQLRRANERVAARDTADTMTRLAGQLIELGHTFGEHRRQHDGIEIRVSQDDLAAWIGTTRESVGRCLARLRADDVVVTGRGRLTVHDTDALYAIALGS